MMKHQRILLASVLTALSCWTAAAQQAEAEDWNRQLRPIAQQLESLRNLKFKKPVPFEKQTLDDFEKFVRKEIREQIPPEQFASMMKGLRRLGMVTRDFELDDEMVKALLSQAAAYYDPDTERFYVLGAGLPAMVQNTIYAHELVHALQDQHFDLNKKMEAFTPKPGQIRNDDAALALRYLVEGEATYVQTLYQLRGRNLPPMAVNMTLAMQARMPPEELMKLNKKTRTEAPAWSADRASGSSGFRTANPSRR